MSFFRFSIRGTFPSDLLHFGTDICNLLHFGAKNSHLCFFLIGFFRVFIDFSLVSSLFPWCSIFFSVVFNWLPKGFHRFYPRIPLFFSIALIVIGFSKVPTGFLFFPVVLKHCQWVFTDFSMFSIDFSVVVIIFPIVFIQSF